MIQWLRLHASNVEGMVSVPGWGTKIPHPACCGQKMNKNKNWKIKYVLKRNNNRREGNGTLLQYSCLENPMDRGAWKAAVHGIAEGQTWLSDFTFTFHFHALEKEMATYSSVLAWRIPGTGEPGELPSLGSHGVRHNWSDLAAAAAACNIDSEWL